MSADKRAEPIKDETSRAYQLQQLERELAIRRRLVHLENIGRYAPALNERIKRHTQRRMDDRR